MFVVVFEFEKLEVYAKGREFRKRIYKLAKLLPKEELKLKVQMRDAARSLTNNIAEGHGRYTFKERSRFCRDARGSLQELLDDVNLCIDEGYAKVDHLDTLRSDALHVLKLINGYNAYLKKCETNQLKGKAVLAKLPKSHLTQLT